MTNTHIPIDIIIGNKNESLLFFAENVKWKSIEVEVIT